MFIFSNFNLSWNVILRHESVSNYNRSQIELSTGIEYAAMSREWQANIETAEKNSGPGGLRAILIRHYTCLSIVRCPPEARFNHQGYVKTPHFFAGRTVSTRVNFHFVGEAKTRRKISITNSFSYTPLCSLSLIALLPCHIECHLKGHFLFHTPSCLNEAYRTVCTPRCLQTSCYHLITSGSPARIHLWLTPIPPPPTRNFSLLRYPPLHPLIVECTYYV